MDFMNMTANEILLFFVFVSAVSAIILLIVLISNMSTKNLETKNIYFNSLIIFHIAYILVDIIWAYGYFNNYSFRIELIRYSKMAYFVIAAFTAFCWFMYIEILMGAKFSRTKKSRLIIGLPILLSVTFTIIIAIVTNEEKIVKNILVSVSQMYIPFIYVLFAGVYCIVMAIKTKNISKKRRYISLCVYPFCLVVISILQLFFLEIPILCIGTAILIIFLYIFKIQAESSTDPLTGINNRSALTKYIGEYTAFYTTYVLMIDVDDFKSINDNFGHLEGDKALITLAKALKDGINKCKEKCFLARYGGDEFIIIASYEEDFDINDVINKLYEAVYETRNITKGYALDVSIGSCKVTENDSILNVIENADEEMYTIKGNKKRNRKQAR